jgi:hypothetical protein
VLSGEEQDRQIGFRLPQHQMVVGLFVCIVSFTAQVKRYFAGRLPWFLSAGQRPYGREMSRCNISISHLIRVFLRARNIEFQVECTEKIDLNASTVQSGERAFKKHGLNIEHNSMNDSIFSGKVTGG